MTEFRPFRNLDPPALAEIWRNQPAQRGLAQPMSAPLLESLVIAKPFFDRRGLIVAVDGGEVVGFVHAGFGPTDDGASLSIDEGAVCMVMVRAGADGALAGELLVRGEAYLRERGAGVIYGGAVRPIAPFYHGLYGGSEQLGVPDADRAASELYASHDYQAVERTVVLQRNLADFRPMVDRRQILLRRSVQVLPLADPPPRNWWEACTFGAFDRLRFELVPKQGGKPLASMTTWNMEAFSSAWGVRAMGLVDLELAPGQRRQGMGTYLVGEALWQMHQQGVGLVEAQVRRSNAIAHALFNKVGFVEVDTGTIYRKQ